MQGKNGISRRYYTSYWIREAWKYRRRRRWAGWQVGSRSVDRRRRRRWRRVDGARDAHGALLKEFGWAAADAQGADGSAGAFDTHFTRSAGESLKNIA